ncbi:hypothetical protein [Shewanella benthica]|uniref:Uncharacterized protein n=1 Tax=Shewanella benthica KT99 TaxID=314608 RepID=A9DJC4_9GAMM|nr:hypothetical protein [Shewanella benthica]EDP98984.1 hypothetical protein KT99_00166 [Shewanella benthica KT99]
MAIIKDLNISKSISIEEFKEKALQVNFDDENEILKLSPYLKMLSNNKGWLEEFIKDGLNDPSNFQIDNLYSSQSYILAEIGERAFLRFAIWSPKGFSDALDEDNFYSYKTAHNHDFSLLTVGYIGSGYTTSLYKINPTQKILGYIGENLDLKYKEKIQLSEGRVILYEAGTDIHIQHEPNEFSISLNLIVEQSQKKIDQFYYDVDSKKIAGYVGNTDLKPAMFMRYAAAMNQNVYKNFLEKISKNHESAITRLYAHRALSQNYIPKSTVISNIKKDKSNMVAESDYLIEKDINELHIWG